MCEVNPEKLAAEMIYRKKIFPGSLCMKCKSQQAAVVVRVNDTLCRSCFLAYTTHKFRSTLGKSKLVKANDRVLLVLSGSHSSTALLNLVKEALSEGAHKRLRFLPGVVFVDESVTLPSKTEPELGIQNIQKLVENFGYPFYCVPIYQDFHTDAVDDCNKSYFCQAFTQLTTLTAKVHFLSIVRMSAVVATARKYSYTKIMIGDTASDLSITLLCNILQGNADAVPADIGVADKRYNDITVIRPLREFSSKEVALYTRLNHLNFIAMPNILTKKGPGSCIQRQTEEFVNNLQAGFPSTVNTIFRTGDKLCADHEVLITPCLLCQRPKRSEETDRSTHFSDKANMTLDDISNSQTERLTLGDVQSSLCYGCNITLKEMGGNYEFLPRSTLENIKKMKNRSRMKNEVKDFLL